ncbi:ParA family protein [Sulfuricurvum sp.]|uniref:ParA family protein n=1 Tax=Sulfuricurvum sp. TaxID=2025608 RepID=UPI0019CAF2B0|nr:ParA family protein [Sulfuricurvum sp.]MBD3806625.1 ParA family protein [Sulfuricurvum sp.]
MIYEFDDENQETKGFGGSKIINSFRYVVGKKDLRDEITDALLNEHTACIDVGANKTSLTLLKALVDSGMLYRLDLVVIPLMDGETDAINAMEVYQTLKKAHHELKVIFALGRVNEARELSCQFDLFLGDQRKLFNQKGIILDAQPEDQKYLIIRDSDTVKYCRIFGVTVWELAQSTADIDAKLVEAIKTGDNPQMIKFLSFKRSLKRDCIEYTRETIKEAFRMIDERLLERK